MGRRPLLFVGLAGPVGGFELDHLGVGIPIREALRGRRLAAENAHDSKERGADTGG